MLQYGIQQITTKHIRGWPLLFLSSTGFNPSRRHRKASSDCQLRNVCPSARHRAIPTRRITVKFHNLSLPKCVRHIPIFINTGQKSDAFHVGGPTYTYDLSPCLVFVIETGRALYEVCVEAEEIVVYSWDKPCSLRESAQTASVVYAAPLLHTTGTGIRRTTREVISHFHLVTKLRIMELHLHSPIRFDGVYRDNFPLYEYTFRK